MQNFDAQFKKIWDTLEQMSEDRRKAAAEFDRRTAEAEKRAAKIDRRLDKVSAQIGGFTNNYGEALEEEFADAMEDEMRIGDIPLHEVLRNVKNRYEFDIAVVNGDCVAVGEIKHKLLPQDVIAFAEERLPHFAEDFPGVAANRKVLGMVGGEVIAADAQGEAEKRGLMVLRLKNKKLVVENAAGARPVPQTA
ncbi:MAG: hypothetical protein ACR2QC_00620 [Gammaproteobacteria bacterium]